MIITLFATLTLKYAFRIECFIWNYAGHLIFMSFLFSFVHLGTQQPYKCEQLPLQWFGPQEVRWCYPSWQKRLHRSLEDTPKPSTYPLNRFYECFRWLSLLYLRLLMWLNITGFSIWFQNKPAKNVQKVSFKSGARRSLSKFRNSLVSSRYRNDLKQVRNPIRLESWQIGVILSKMMTFIY